MTERKAVTSEELAEMVQACKDTDAQYFGFAKAGGWWFKNHKTETLYRVDRVHGKYVVTEKREPPQKDKPKAHTATKAHDKPEVKKKAPVKKAKPAQDTHEVKARLINPEPIKEKRAHMLVAAKERKIKYFRVMRRDELERALAKGVSAEEIKKIQDTASKRWRDGWRFNRKQKGTHGS